MLNWLSKQTISLLAFLGVNDILVIEIVKVDQFNLSNLSNYNLLIKLKHMDQFSYFIIIIIWGIRELYKIEDFGRGELWDIYFSL